MRHSHLLKTYSEKEESLNVLTHFFGFLLAVLGTFYLTVLRAENSLEIFSYAVYGGSGIVLYLFSCLYHKSTQPRLRRILKICDHAAIYFFIAGCYTPFILLHLKSPAAQDLLMWVWVLALLGILLKLFLTGRFRLISTLIYLAMGWLVVVLGEELSHTLSTTTILWLITGGLSYSIGTVFYLFRRIPYHHAIWHLFVLGGSACHFIALITAP